MGERRRLNRLYDEKIHIAIVHSLSVVMAVLILVAIVIAVHEDLSVLYYTYVINIAADIIAMIMLCALTVTSYSLEKASLSFASIAFFICLNLFWDEMAWISNHRVDLIHINFVSNIFFYLNAYFIFGSYWGYLKSVIKDDSLYRKFTIPVILDGVIGIIPICLNAFVPIYFWIDAAGNYERTPYYTFSLVPCFVAFLLFFAFLIMEKMPIVTKCIISTYLIIPALMVIIQTLFYGLSILYVGVAFSLLIIYCTVHIGKEKEIIMEREYLTQQRLELLQREKEILEGQTQIMISQIQPHFLYNALGSIGRLYKIDPEKAADATTRFAKYLRMNLDSFDKLRTILFEEELEHVRTYLDLEKMRYDDLIVDYSEIECTHFSLPALSIQPLVENAVIHGFMSREEGGRIVIKEQEIPGFHQITIEDDGVGFDVNHPHLDPGKSHIGLENVRTRIANMVNGTVTIESTISVGTKVTVLIPAEQ